MLNQENPLAENIENAPEVDKIESTSAHENHITEAPIENSDEEESIVSETLTESPVANERSATETVIENTIASPEPKKKRKHQYRKPLIAAIAVMALTLSVVALYKTKPTEKDFELWVKNEAAKKRKESNNVIQKGVSIATQIQLLATYRYSDHILFVTVKAKANKEKLKFIGIANCWILLP